MQTFLWNPWSLFGELERSMRTAGSSEWPQFDIEDTDDETVISADLPGMGDDDVEVTMSPPYLVVRGERKAKDGRYVERARFHGAFARRFWLGEGYDADRVTAHLRHGELTIRLEKAPKAKPRRIALTSGEGAPKVKGLLGDDKDKNQAA